jgi:hypothetical protein
MLAPVKVVRRAGDNSRSRDRAYGYWFVGRTRTEYLFDRDYKPMAARSWDNKSQRVQFRHDQWIKDIDAQCYFFTDGVKLDLSDWAPYDLFANGCDVRHLFVTSSWSFIWPDLMEVEERRSMDKVFRQCKNVTTLHLKPIEDWLR